MVVWKQPNTHVPAANDDEGFKKSVVMGTVEKFTSFVNAVIDEKVLKVPTNILPIQKKSKNIHLWSKGSDTVTSYE